MIHRLNKLQLYIITLFALAYTIADMTTLRMNTLQIYLFAGFTIVSFLLISLSVSTKITKKQIIVLSLLCIYIFLLPMYFIWNEHFFLKYFASDFLTFLLIFFFIMFAHKIGYIIDEKYIIYLFFALFLAYSISVFFVQGEGGLNRKEPIHFIVFVILFCFLHYRSGFKRSMALLTYGVLIFLSYYSGERTVIVLALLLLLLFLFLNSKKLFLFLLLPIIFYSVYTINFVDFGRFGTLFSGDGDLSLNSRFYEVVDVFRYYHTQANLFNYLFGFGFSATYIPHDYIGHVINISSKGTVHHIHFFPVLIFFRFGVIGLLMLLFLYMHIVIYIFSYIKSSGDKTRFKSTYVFALLAMLAYMLNSFMRTIFVDPFFYIVLSLYFFYIIYPSLKYVRK